MIQVLYEPNFWIKATEPPAPEITAKLRFLTDHFRFSICDFRLLERRGALASRASRTSWPPIEVKFAKTFASQEEAPSICDSRFSICDRVKRHSRDTSRIPDLLASNRALLRWRINTSTNRGAMAHSNCDSRFSICDRVTRNSRDSSRIPDLLDSNLALLRWRINTSTNRGAMAHVQPWTSVHGRCRKRIPSRVATS